MNPSIIRLGSFTSILAGTLLIAAHALNLGSGEYGSVYGNFLVFMSHLLLVFAFFGLYIFQGEKNGTVGFLAMLLGNIGNIVVTAIVFVEIAQASLEKASQVLMTSVNEPLSTYGPLLFVLGMILLGISIIRGKVFPVYSGYLLVAGTIVFAAAGMINDFKLIIEVIGAIFTGAGFIAAGMTLRSDSHSVKIKG
ncbi:hypothetical protein [Neobacillus soli]|uniref:hypothetical protein n=1 Tax=Neobacillus soli TaxID=220688 RepID=UPI00082649A0|nr:hypothetical protein [Neobacillus soli]